MVTTRSRNPTAQPKLEDLSDGKKRLGSSKSQCSKSSGVTGAKSSSKKRQAPTDVASSKPAKKGKSSGGGTAASTAGEQPIIINRAPVLHLWSACVAQFVHPELSWETCLSAGSAVSSITAIAKGRSIGKIESPEDTDEKRKKREQRPQEDAVIEVMRFRLRVKDGLALVGSEQKGKPGSEQTLKSKFGEEGYERAKRVFENVLSAWKGDEAGLSKRAFGMYEDFRPSVKAGQGGWGKKGELDLDTVRSAIAKS